MTESLFDHARVEECWRTQPTDLGGWANRANAMFVLAKRYHDALSAIANRDFGGYSLSADEADMRDDARRALGMGE